MVFKLEQRLNSLIIVTLKPLLMLPTNFNYTETCNIHDIISGSVLTFMMAQLAKFKKSFLSFIAVVIALL